MLKEAKELGERFCCALEHEQDERADERGEYWMEDVDEDEWKEKVHDLFFDECRHETSRLICGEDNLYKCELLLDLYSYLEEENPGALSELESVFQSVHEVWTLFLADRKTSLFLEVLKLDGKKAVQLLDVPVEESEVRVFVQCLPYISQLRFSKLRSGMLEQPKFLQKLICEAAEREEETGEKILELLSSVCDYKTFLRMHKEDNYLKSELLLDLYSNLKDYERQTGRSVLPALEPLFRSVPAIWSIYLSDRKASTLLEVLKLQQEKKPVVKLLDVTDEESQVKIFVQCLPYISKLSFSNQRPGMLKQPKFLRKLICEAAAREEETGEKILEALSSVCNYKTFLRMHKNDNLLKSELLLDLYSYLKDYETQTGRSVLLALEPLYRSVPAVWSIFLSARKASTLLEVLKLQQEKKPVVKLLDVTDEESEVKIFVQCLPYISKLCFTKEPGMLEQPKFLQKLICEAAEREEETGEKILELFSSVFNPETFLLMGRDWEGNFYKCELLLDLYSDMKDYEKQTGRRVLPALEPLYQSVPAVWSMFLSAKKTSVLLEVLKQQKEKKPVELLDVTVEESEVKIFLQCLPYISQLSFTDVEPGMAEQPKFLQMLICEAAEREEETGEKILELFSSVFNPETFLLMGREGNFYKCELLLDLYSDMKDYEKQTGRRVLPALEPLYQSVPAVWSIYLSARKTNVLLEVLKQQKEKKPVELLDVTGEESEVKIFLRCLPYISQLSFTDEYAGMAEQPTFLGKLICEATEQEEETGENILELFSSVCNYETFLLMHRDDNGCKTKLLLDLYLYLKDYETQTGRSVLPALKPLYQSVPAVWSVYLSDHGMTSLLLEVLKLQQEKKPLELLDFSNEESEVKTFFQCLPYISQLRSSKSVLLRLLTLVSGASETDRVMRAGSLGRALGGELDLSKTRLHQKACKRLALVLKQSEGLTELDLSHCQLTDQQLGILIPHLHKAQVLDLSHNKLTDAVTDRLLQLLSTNTCIKTMRLLNNCFMDTAPFMKDERFEINKEINKDVDNGKKRRKKQKNKKQNKKIRR